MMINKIKNISLWAFVLCLLFAACQDEWRNLAGNVVEGVPVTVSLNFAATPESDIVVTRADNSQSDLYRLAIFIYSGEKFEQLVRTADGTLNIEKGNTTDDGVYYKAQFETTSGVKNLLAVANSSTDEDINGFWKSVSEIADKATKGELTFEELKKQVIHLNATGDEMQPIHITGESQMLMSAWNEGVTITAGGQVSAYGNNVGDKEVIFRLDRSMAHITFRIPGKVEGAKGSFTPTSYKVYNVPLSSYLTNTDKEPVPIDDKGEATFGFIDFAQDNVGSLENGYYPFEFYMPENIYGLVTEDAAGNSIGTEYHNRDKWSGDEGSSPKDKTWTFAPQTSTFVVISGTYEEKDESGNPHYTANVDYTIHFGDFSTEGDNGNFSVERNCKYTYTVKVLDINRMIVEAKKEGENYQEGAEGMIYDYQKSKYAYQLDAHYEQVFLEYNLTDIAKNLKVTEETSLGDAIANALILVIQSEAMDYENSEETPDKPYTVRNKRGTMKPYKIYMDALGTDHNEDAAKQAKDNALKGNINGDKGFDYKWIEFWPQSDKNIAKYPGVSLWSREEVEDLYNKQVYGGNVGEATEESKKLMDVYDVIVAMGKVVKKIYNQMHNISVDNTVSTEPNKESGITVTNIGEENNPVYVARFTAFVNEYYYYRHPLTGKKIDSWSLFTNKMPREMIIAMSTDISKDGNTSYSILHSYISQLSIETFYSSRKNSAVNGFGIETYNETPLTTFGNYLSTDLTRDKGRKNQLNLINGERTSEGWGISGHLYWDNLINYSKNGWTEPVTSAREDHVLDAGAYEKLAAYVACLSRNRDLNGNGEIEDGEVRWYLPSLNEYIRIGIGTRALSNAAQLYTGDKQAIGNALHSGNGSIYPLSRISEGTLYYTSSDNNARVYWPVEKGSYSSNNNEWAGEDGSSYSIKKPIRCIRLLPGNNDGENVDISTSDVDSDPTYEYDPNTRILTFSGKLVESLYREREYDRLVPHNEDDAANRYYQKIVVAEKDVDEQFSLGQIIQAERYSTENPCANYHEDDDGGAIWRVPNLVELSAMHVVPTTDDGVKLVGNGHACCTQFSNQNVRYGFRIAEDQIQAYGGGTQEYLFDKFTVRCVRDME